MSEDKTMQAEAEAKDTAKNGPAEEDGGMASGSDDLKREDSKAAKAVEDENSGDQAGNKEAADKTDSSDAGKSEGKSKDEQDGESGKDDSESGESDEKSDGDENDKKTETAESVKKAADERYARLMAEFQNYKKRTAKEKSDIHAYANEKLVKELLEVLDNFDRALELIEKAQEGDDDSNAKVYEGIQLTYTQFRNTLEKAGLKEIDALGEDFDPNKHNAVMNEDSDDYESGKVSKVLQKGYTLNDKVIRPAMVAVAQ